jgi:hypothetical protein
MAQANNPSTTSPSRFHNVSNVALADMLGQADAVLKGAEAECKLLKDEFKNRGLVVPPFFKAEVARNVHAAIEGGATC